MKILLIEDNPGDIRLLQGYLKESSACRFEITQAGGLSMGIERLAEARFDAVLLDLSLPDSQGLDTLVRLHEAAKDVPIVVLTGDEDEVLGVRLIQAGAQDYLVKGDVTGPLLVHSLRYAAERKRAEEELCESETRLRAILDNSPNLVFLKDTQGRYLHINRQFERAYNISREAVAGKTDMEVFPAEQAAAFRANDCKVLQAGVPLEFEEVALYYDGPHTSIVSKFPLYGGDGKPYAICGITTDITQRKRAEEELQRTLDQVRTLSRRLEVVQEDERTRIARELHDELGVRLTCLKMDLSRLQPIMNEASRPKLQEKVLSMIEQVDTTIAAVQGLVAELRPGVLDDLGLVAAIEWQCRDFERRSGIRCLVDSKEEDIPLDSARATAAFRICQEALTNVVRHARAKEIRVHLDKLDRELLLEIHDDGQGILPEKVTDARSLGLLGMRERAAAVRGALRIVGLPGQGTTVTLRLPYE